MIKLSRMLSPLLFLSIGVYSANLPQESENSETENSCPQINQRLVDADVDPKFKLNPDQFITPVYIWGPSSQLQGLREAIGVAIRLNRTLLLPPFLTHQSDSTGPDRPVPGMRHKQTFFLHSTLIYLKIPKFALRALPIVLTDTGENVQKLTRVFSTRR